jgi:hypothetical protein
MTDRENLLDITRQTLVIGTSCITDATGNRGYKTEVVQASALVRIASALEAQTEILQATTRASFTPEQREDGMNHFLAVHVKESNLVHIDFLATGPAIAKAFITNIGEVIKHAIAKAEQEGGLDNG